MKKKKEKEEKGREAGETDPGPVTTEHRSFKGGDESP